LFESKQHESMFITTSGFAMKHVHKIEQLFWSTANYPRASAKRNVIPAYRVGVPFRQGRCFWPEGAQFTCGLGGPELTLFRTDIQEGIVDAVRRGDLEVALIVEPPLIVLTYRFGESIPWDDAPYCWHLQPEGWRVKPSMEHSTEARALLWITLVGAHDGIIYVQRGVTLSPGFSRSLESAIRAQALMSFDAEKCTSAIAKLFLNHPRTTDRLGLAKARTAGNG
jgi:hypothetical protein